ncbi:MAG: multidrug effflux MFS transporter [Sulfurospirillaceae bacterium]|nr:multidrug effflux MFS transporter [Sulfurospirillaceae bacterium]
MTLFNERRIVFILASLAAITPLAIDMYLPALPRMAEQFSTPISEVQFSLSLYFFGMALGQLIGGPISDAYGRRPVISFGLTLFGLSSLALVFVNSIEFFLFFRTLQSLGGGFTTVNVSATVRDYFSGKEGARILSLIASVMLIAPLFGPMLGSLILHVSTWESIFVLLTLYAFATLLMYRKVFKSAQIKKTKATPFRNYIEVLSHPQAMLFVVAMILCTSGMYTFITTSSFIYIEHFKVSPFIFSLCFGSNVLMMMLFGQLNAKLVKTIEPLALLRLGMLAQALLSVLFFVLHANGSIWMLFPIIGLYLGMLGFIFSNAISLVLEFFPHISASANAIIGVLQYSAGALMGFVASSLHDGTLLPIAGVMMSVSISGVLLLLLGTRHYNTPCSHRKTKV